MNAQKTYAQEYLERVRKLDQLIAVRKKAWEREDRRLISIAEDTSARLPDGMPYCNTGKASNKVADAVGSKVILDCEMDKELTRYIQERREIIHTLEKLPTAEYGALYRHYVQYKSWSRAADEMKYSKRQVLRIKQRGLKMLQALLDGRAAARGNKRDTSN